MTPNLLDDLEKIVALSEKATPGPWVANDGELATDLYWAGGGMVADALAEFADGLSDPPNAHFVAAAVNFLRTHHATLADMAKRMEAAERDAARWNVVRNNTGDGLRLIRWNSKAPDELQVMFPSPSLCDLDADDAIDATQEGEG